MLNHPDSTVLVHNWFTPEECDKVINYAVNYGQKNYPRVGFGAPDVPKGGNPGGDTRDGILYFFTQKEIQEKCLAHVKNCNKRYWNLDLYNLEPLQLTVYRGSPINGDHYRWHRDQEFKGKNNPNHDKELIRKVSFSVNLTQQGVDYTGGDLQFNQGLRPYTPTAMGNKGCGTCFVSQTYHQVDPITSGTRIALVGWVSGPPYR
jgi:hypothetical protein